jgi:hypothetical protein
LIEHFLFSFVKVFDWKSMQLRASEFGDWPIDAPGPKQGQEKPGHRSGCLAILVFLLAPFKKRSRSAPMIFCPEQVPDY